MEQKPDGHFTATDHRRSRRGRPNPLDDKEFAYQVAAAFIDGKTRKQMCELFGVSDPGTITRWRRDPRVKTHALKMAEDRTIQITRRIDSRIEAILQNNDDLTVMELVALRKELLGGAMRMQVENADEETIGEVRDLFDKDPETAKQLMDLLRGGAEGSTPDSD